MIHNHSLYKQQLILEKYLKVIASCKTKGQLARVIDWRDKTLKAHFSGIGYVRADSIITGAINCLIKRYKYQEKWNLWRKNTVLPIEVINTQEQ